MRPRDKWQLHTALWTLSVQVLTNCYSSQTQTRRMSREGGTQIFATLNQKMGGAWPVLRRTAVDIAR